MTIRAALFALAIAPVPALIPAPAEAQQKANRLFGAQIEGSRQTPSSIGSYSRGCAAGLVELPETGPTWQAMRLSRNRNWGHPETVAFIQRLSAGVRRFGWPGLYIGDMSQPRGGPMATGHASHQIGLDIDIWMDRPKNLRLSRNARENLSAKSVRARSQKTVNNNWTPTHAAVLELAARDPAVDRIFVTPPVKVYLCERAKRSDRAWLRKIRPFYGHNYHFHVRLKCPEGSRECVTQQPTVNELSNGGDGCDASLEWWVTDYLNPPKPPPGASRKPAPRKRHPREYTMADLPRSCVGVLNSD